MKTTLKTRKPVNKLTKADLAAFPIWEFASDEEDSEGQDETWVRPVDRKQVPAGAFTQLVASDFTTASGAKLHGFMTVTTFGKIEISAGALVGKGLYCVLPNMSEKRTLNERPKWMIKARDDIQKALKDLGAKVFPIAYTLRARIRGEKSVRSGVVE